MLGDPQAQASVIPDSGCSILAMRDSSSTTVREGRVSVEKLSNNMAQSWVMLPGIAGRPANIHISRGSALREMDLHKHR